MAISVNLLIQAANSSSSTTPQPVTDLEILEASLNSVSDMLGRVLTYVRSVIAGERKGDAAVGRYLMDTLGASTEDLEKGGFNSSLQVRKYDANRIKCVLMMSLGYPDDVLPCQSCTVASRSVGAVSAYFFFCLANSDSVLVMTILLRRYEMKRKKPYSSIDCRILESLSFLTGIHRISPLPAPAWAETTKP